MQSVPREMRYSKALDTLIINPIKEVEKLRTARLNATTLTLAADPAVVAHGDALDVAVNFTCSDTAPGAVCAGTVLGFKNGANVSRFEMCLSPSTVETRLHTPKAVAYHEQSHYCRFMIGHSLGRMESSIQMFHHI